MTTMDIKNLQQEFNNFEVKIYFRKIIKLKENLRKNIIASIVEVLVTGHKNAQANQKVLNV